MEKKIKSLLLFAPLILIGVGGAEASEISIWGANLTADSDKIPYVFDNNNGAVIGSDLGDGTAFGLDFSTDIMGLTLGIGFASSNPTASGAFDSNPLVSNDCNVNPVQGVVSDCYDNATIDIDTTAQTVALTVGKSFALGWGNVTPYGGIRQLTFEQTIKGAYNFPGGYETTWKRDVDFSGFGPWLGVKLNVPVGASGFFFDGDLAFAQIMTGERDQKVNEVRTLNGVFNASYSASENQDVDPTTIDLTLMAGYKVGTNVTLGLGYRYQKITGVIDSHETNQGAYIPGYGGTEGDLELSGAFAKASFAF